MKQILPALLFTWLLSLTANDAWANKSAVLDNDLHVSFKTPENTKEFKWKIRELLAYEPSENEIYWLQYVQSNYLCKPFLHPDLIPVFPKDITQILEKNSNL